MKQVFLFIIIGMVFGSGFAQSGKKAGSKATVITKKAGLPANVFYLSTHGAISDAEIGMNSVTFGTDNTPLIQSVLDKAINSPITVYWDGKYSVTGLKIYSNTTIIAGAGCGAILRNHSDRSIFINAGQSFGTKKDSNIVISGGIWNGNYYNQEIPRGAQSKGDSINGLVGCFRFYGVDNLIVRDAILYKPATYALAAANVTHVLYENLIVDVGPDPLINNDGLHIDGNSRYGVIRHCIINAHDDGIGLNADDLYLYWFNWNRKSKDIQEKNLFYPEAAAGPISDILIDDITFNSSLFGIRILSGQSRVDRITIRNIKGYTKGYAMVLDNYQHNPEIVSYAGPGNIGTVNVEDFDVAIYPGPENMPNESCINVSTNVEQLILKNIKRKEFSALEPTVLIRGKNTVIGSLELDGYYSLDTTRDSEISHVLIDGASVNQLSISNVSISRTQKLSANHSVLLKTENGGNVNSLQFNRINTEGIASLISNASGKLSIINASNVIHTYSSGFPFFLDNELNIVKALTISNFYGTDQIAGGKSKILKKSGDAF
ncbi:MAG: hypothetical protein IPN67_13475 [Bacteroidales bacterium]|nr:hypothetical protein [Bacteroidales bacterium]